MGLSAARGHVKRIFVGDRGVYFHRVAGDFRLAGNFAAFEIISSVFHGGSGLALAREDLRTPAPFRTIGSWSGGPHVEVHDLAINERGALAWLFLQTDDPHAPSTQSVNTYDSQGSHVLDQSAH